MYTCKDAVQDELASSLLSFSVTSSPSSQNSIHKLHPNQHAKLFKSRGDKFVQNYEDRRAAQEKKRRQILKGQKSRRENYLDFARSLANNSEIDIDDGMKESPSKLEDENDSSMVVEQITADIQTTVGEDTSMEQDLKPKPLKKTYSNQLMFSEWMLGLPSDIYDNKWLVIPCPVGKRCLVIAANGQTKAFAKNGKLIRQFPSDLPHGASTANHNHSRTVSSSVTMLDCLFSYQLNIIYVLDIMMFNGQSYYECDTEFRMVFCKNKLQEECPNLMKKSKLNTLPFVILPVFPITSHISDVKFLKEEKISALKYGEHDKYAQLDGILFYHKDVNYLPGTDNPLILWLKGFMIPEMFEECQVEDISDAVMEGKPSSYISKSDFITDFDTKRASSVAKWKGEAGH